MDLTERGDGEARHPWEVQRFEAYRRVLHDHDALESERVLDVGAGDGWFAEQLVEHLPTGAIVTCWDAHYGEADLDTDTPGVRRTRDRPEPGHDLVLVLDVLEHIEEPGAFIFDELTPLADAGTPVLVAVPAYRRLFSAHDVALGHHRRYGRRQLLEQLAPWVDVVDHGSLFWSLLLPRAMAVGVERVRSTPAPADDHGVGGWAHGPLVTTAANRLLAFDAGTGRLAHRAGVRLPGLSHWAFGRVR